MIEKIKQLKEVDKKIENIKEQKDEEKDLEQDFIELIGEGETKPFECVGTYSEARYAVSLLIEKLGKENLPYLLKFYLDNYKLELDGNEILKYNVIFI